MDQKVEQLLAILGEYLSMPSLDGRADRQAKRKQLTELLSEIRSPKPKPFNLGDTVIDAATVQKLEKEILGMPVTQNGQEVGTITKAYQSDKGLMAMVSMNEGASYEALFLATPKAL